CRLRPPEGRSARRPRKLGPAIVRPRSRYPISATADVTSPCLARCLTGPNTPLAKHLTASQRANRSPMDRPAAWLAGRPPAPPHVARRQLQDPARRARILAGRAPCGQAIARASRWVRVLDATISWSGSWSWSLPLIVFTVVIHGFGLIL